MLWLNSLNQSNLKNIKYTSKIEINSPVDKVIELFDNPDHMDKWMKGLQSFEHISGNRTKYVSEQEF